MQSSLNVQTMLKLLSFTNTSASSIYGF